MRGVAVTSRSHDPCAGLAGTPFADMTPAQKRVAIALDVIAQLKAKRYSAITRLYIRRNTRREDSYGIRARTLVRETCAVCALGAAVVSSARLAGGIGPAMDFIDTRARADSVTPALAPYFDVAQLGMIETAFEQNQYDGAAIISATSAGVPLHDALAFGKACDSDPTIRMVTIMQNIVRNNGTFNPMQPATVERCEEAGHG